MLISPRLEGAPADLRAADRQERGRGCLSATHAGEAPLGTQREAGDARAQEITNRRPASPRWARFARSIRSTRGGVWY